MDLIEIILMLVMAVLLWMLYHSIFDVAYFSGKAMLTEIITCLMLGGLIANKMMGLVKILLPVLIAVLVIVIIVSKVKEPKEDTQEEADSDVEVANETASTETESENE